MAMIVNGNPVGLEPVKQPVKQLTAATSTPETPIPEHVPIEVPKAPEPPAEDKTPVVISNDPKLQQELMNDTADAYFILKDNQFLNDLFDQVRVFRDNLIVQFTPESLIIKLMDASRVAMIDYEIKKEQFEEYQVIKAGYMRLNLKEIHDIVFKAVNKDTVVKVASESTPKPRVVFTLTDSSRTRTRDWNSEYFDDEAQDLPNNLPRPKIEYTARFIVTTKAWSKELEELEKVSDHVHLTVKPEMIRAVANGDNKTADDKYETGSDIVLTIETKTPEAKSCYSLSYLKELINPKLSDTASIEIANDMPVKVILATKYGDLIEYVAPRIEDK